MAASLNINDILSQVKQLDKEDQLTLLQRMAYLLKRGETKKDWFSPLDLSFWTGK